MKEHPLKKRIKDQGRTLIWIAKKTGMSLPFLSLCMSGQRNLSKDKELLITKLIS